MTRKVHSQAVALTLTGTDKHAHTFTCHNLRAAAQAARFPVPRDEMSGLSNIRTSLAPSCGGCTCRLQPCVSCNTRLASSVMKVIVFGGFDGSADHRSTEVPIASVSVVLVLSDFSDPGHRQHDLLHGSDNGWFSKLCVLQATGGFGCML